MRHTALCMAIVAVGFVLLVFVARVLHLYP